MCSSCQNKRVYCETRLHGKRIVLSYLNYWKLSYTHLFFVFFKEFLWFVLPYLQCLPGSFAAFKYLNILTVLLLLLLLLFWRGTTAFGLATSNGLNVRDSDDGYMSMGSGGMTIDRGNRSTRRKTERNSIRHKSHMDCSVTEPGLLQWETGDTPSTIRVIYVKTQAPI
jgi:hypothetical protein